MPNSKASPRKNIANMEECAAICSAESTCAGAITWDGPGGHCWLKVGNSGDWNRKRKKQQSGVHSVQMTADNCFEMQDENNNLDNSEGMPLTNIASMKECAARCAAESTCVGAVRWNGKAGDKGHCWLKVGSRKDDVWNSKKYQAAGVQSLQMTAECRNDLEGKRARHKADDLVVEGGVEATVDVDARRFDCEIVVVVVVVVVVEETARAGRQLPHVLFSVDSSEETNAADLHILAYAVNKD
eukprot:g12639.t1